MTSRAEQLLREAAKELKLADGQQRKADDHKWAAAERMWKANKEEGVNTREIGSAVGVSHSTAQFHIRVWTQYGLETAVSTRPSFTEAYYETRNESPEAREDRAVERVARERPEVIATALTKNPKAAAAVTEHVTEELSEARAAATRGTEKNLKRREAEGQRKEREAVGDETIDNLEYSQELRDREMDLIKARGWLGGFLRNTTRETLEDAPDSWTEGCYRWLDDLDAKVQMARALLSGDDIDEGLRELLAQEGR